MRRSSRSSSADSGAGRAIHRAVLVAACGLLLAGTGCESLQRKFTRKPKKLPPPPSPVTSFIDYTRTITPLDLYRKHYLMFDYWHGELVRELEQQNLNTKRVRAASKESLQELERLQSLLLEEPAARLTPILEARRALDRQLQARADAHQALLFKRDLETQARAIHRDFVWRKVEEQLKPRDRVPAAGGRADAEDPASP
jgi:hypothetical protein